MFECLLRTCLCHGRTSHAEREATFALKAENDTTILIFKVDSDAGRACLGLNNHEKCCDLIVAIFRRVHAPVLAFVELKGQDHSTAIEQIEVTQQAFRRRISATTPHYQIVSAIVTSASAPVTKNRNLKKQLKQSASAPVILKLRRPISVDEFLRQTRG